MTKVLLDTDKAAVIGAVSGATVTDAGTPASDDKVLIQDTSDSDNLKYVNVSDLPDQDISGKANLASPTFTGTVVLPDGQALVTPALGTPASGVLTNATGLPVGGLADGTDGELITWDASGEAAVVAAGTADQVLTSNGAGAAPTFQDAGGSSFVGVRVVETTEQTLSSNDVFAFGAEEFDTNDFHDNSTNNSRITIPSGLGGTYLIGATLSTDREEYFSLQLNRTLTIGGASTLSSASGLNEQASTTTLRQLVEGDYIEMFASGGGLTTKDTPATNMWVYKVN